MDASIAATFAPDWSTIDREIVCPLCDYNLRGLTEPRCPECGHQFDWQMVLDPNLQTHPYLFEVHPERNIRSFLQTLVRNFHAGSLWKTLQPSHRANARRLVLYGIICSVIAMVPCVLLTGWQVIEWGTTTNTLVMPTAGALLGSAGREWLIRGVFFLCLIGAVFPWLNFLALRVFGQSMRRARVKTVHVLRCTIYCADLIVWNALFQCAAIAWYLARGTSFWDAKRLMEQLIFLGIIGFTLNFGRLVVAYRKYMRFPHVIATIFASQLIVFLSIPAGAAIVSYIWGE